MNEHEISTEIKCHCGSLRSPDYYDPKNRLRNGCFVVGVNGASQYFCTATCYAHAHRTEIQLGDFHSKVPYFPAFFDLKLLPSENAALAV